MPRGTPHGVAGVNEVISLSMCPLGGGERLEHHAMMHGLCHRGKVFTDLHAVGRGRNGFGSPHFLSTGHDAKGVQVAHPPAHIQIDHVLGRGDLADLRSPFKGPLGMRPSQHVQHGDPETGLGGAHHKVAAGDLVCFMEETFHDREVVESRTEETGCLLHKDKLAAGEERLNDVAIGAISALVDHIIEHGPFIVAGQTA